MHIYSDDKQSFKTKMPIPATEANNTVAFGNQNANSLLNQRNQDIYENKPASGDSLHAKLLSRFLNNNAFRGVNVHFNSEKPAQFDAEAYTKGNDIYLGQGRESFLPHEFGHIIQQRQGKVEPTGTENGVQVNDDPQFEAEATKIGNEEVSGSGNASVGNCTPVIQFGKSSSLHDKKKSSRRRRKPYELGVKKTAMYTKELGGGGKKRIKMKIGQRGAKVSDQKRLMRIYKRKVSGRTHESEHVIGYSAVSGALGRSGKGFEGLFEKYLPAYQEVLEAHRDHVGTGSNIRGEKAERYVRMSGPTSGDEIYRRDQLEALCYTPFSAPPTPISNAAQLNQLGYSDLYKNGKYDSTSVSQANNSFFQMAKELKTLPFMVGDDMEKLQNDPK
jgi:hypothetical protein